MIFGKTDTEREIERQEWLRKNILGVRKFVLFDRLHTGEWVLFQYVWSYTYGLKRADGVIDAFYHDWSYERFLFAEQDDAHVHLYLSEFRYAVTGESAIKELGL